MTAAEKSVLILGAGESGLGAAKLLSALKIPFVICDEAAISDSTREQLLKLGATKISVGKVLCPEAFHQTYTIVSPGIPVESTWIQELKSAGLKWLSEIEFASQHAKGKVLALTGSLGKTSLATLCAQCLEAEGYSVGLAGNIGKSFSAAVAEQALKDWWVIEVSSFQLESCEDFAPDVALLLNLFPNHLDRHHTMENYAETKAKLFQAMAETGTAIFPESLCEEMTKLSKSKARICCFNEQVEEVPGQVLPAANAAAYIEVMSACGVSKNHAGKTLQHFKSLPHRQEQLCELNGVTIVNDSKSTCLAALKGALLNRTGKIRLIAGGKGKKEDYNSIKELLAKLEIHIYLIGEESAAMYNSWKDSAACEECGELKTAFERAWENRAEGDTIIFSPACASFDQFKNFEERGAAFCAIVEKTTQEICEK